MNADAILGAPPGCLLFVGAKIIEIYQLDGTLRYTLQYLFAEKTVPLVADPDDGRRPQLFLLRSRLRRRELVRGRLRRRRRIRSIRAPISRRCFSMSSVAPDAPPRRIVIEANGRVMTYTGRAQPRLAYR